MEFYGEQSMATDTESNRCKGCKFRGETSHCLDCLHHEWNVDTRHQAERYSFKDLYGPKDQKAK